MLLTGAYRDGMRGGLVVGVGAAVGQFRVSSESPEPATGSRLSQRS